MRLLSRLTTKGWSQPEFWTLSRPIIGGSWGPVERIETDFERYVHDVYKADGVVFACIAARAMVFAQARFLWQRFRDGRPTELFGNTDLAILEQPWPNASTGDLLTLMEQDVSLAGNFYGTIVDDADGRRFRRLRPDRVYVVTGSRLEPRDEAARAPDARILFYIYDPHKGGLVPASAYDAPEPGDPHVYLPEDIVHYTEFTDPLCNWLGMSWLTPVIREIQGDMAATEHKLAFFKNGATPSMAIRYDASISREAFDAFVERFKKDHEGLHKGYKTLHLGGGADVTPLTMDFRQLDFKVTQGAGEPLALDTPIPTAGGWTTMGAIQIGDHVIDRNGCPARVVGVSPVYAGRDCYRVTFDDRTSLVCDAGHLWRAMDRATKKRAEAVYTTAQIRAMIEEWQERGVGQAHRIALPAADPLIGTDADLLVDPYVLGVWLGDGQTAGAAICGAEEDLVFVAAEIERRGYSVSRWAVKPGRVSVIGVPGGLLAALDALGVLGDKHIPASYLRASFSQRLDLLRGLMDTDGTVGSRGKETCSFSSKWEHLARQVAELARSLGYRATVTHKTDVRSRTGGDWRVTFRANPERNPFLLPRKAERCQTPIWVRNRRIVSVEPTGSVPVRCIAVDSPDHLFVAGEGWVLTHNTRIAAAAGAHPVIVGLSEGLQGSSLNAGNFQAARRLFVDGRIRYLWSKAAPALQSVLPVPPGARLWYDDRDIAFLRDDAMDEARRRQVDAAAIRQLIDAGFDPDVAVEAITSGDLRRLRNSHSGLYSVQLQPLGTQPSAGRAAASEGGT